MTAAVELPLEQVVIPRAAFEEVRQGVLEDAAARARHVAEQLAESDAVLSINYLMGHAIASINRHLRTCSPDDVKPLTFSILGVRQRTALFWGYVQAFAGAAVEVNQC